MTHPNHSLIQNTLNTHPTRSGNTGIGYEAALALLRQKYEVTLACRDADKSLAAKSKLE